MKKTKTKTWTVYKLVNYANRSYYVAGALALDYELGKVTRPTIENSLLFAFRTARQARDYGLNGRIFKCITTSKPVSFRNVGRLSIYNEAFLARKFWNRSFEERQKMRNFSILPCPVGTIGCKNLKPVKWVAL